MSIKALASRYRMKWGEFPKLELDYNAEEKFWGRDPFDEQERDGLSPNLQMDVDGTLDGHNLAQDSTLMDAMLVDQRVPLSPLFVRDLAGRTIYIGCGPEVKTNDEWASYRPPLDEEGKPLVPNVNPLVPLVVFPRYCRDVARMKGKELLEQVFLTKFRCLEMSMGYNGMPSSLEEPVMASVGYSNPNLYPYKLRLDTFYIDGWKLPQTSMVYARGENVGVDTANAHVEGERFMAMWRGREAGTSYEDWIEQVGKHEIERMFEMGCTVIPTFEACNGFHVVGRDFSLQDYWPGRAVLGLHDVLESQPSNAPAGTILQVVSPGFVTADHIEKAQVVVSDGSGYVSPNESDGLPFIPNLNLPHSRTATGWGLTWIPTDPAHFEAPALWGWDVETGRFLQVSGPLWDPLHYYYASVDEVLSAYNSHVPGGERGNYVHVPEHMTSRFYPTVAMPGFDTMSKGEYDRRASKSIPLRSCLLRVHKEKLGSEMGYHPMPPEFEFEIDPFWFPELHPANRDLEACPPELQLMIMPVTIPLVGTEEYVASVDMPTQATWATDPSLMARHGTDADAIERYPELVRYLVDDISLEELMALSPLPFLSDQREFLEQPLEGWWRDEQGHVYDSARVLDGYMSGVHDALWDFRQRGIDLVKFRHMLYQTAPHIYILGWWNGASVGQLQSMFEAWQKGITEGNASSDNQQTNNESQELGVLSKDSRVRPVLPQALPEEEGNL